jgi:hypothetical protein
LIKFQGGNQKDYPEKTCAVINKASHKRIGKKKYITEAEQQA